MIVTFLGGVPVVTSRCLRQYLGAGNCDVGRDAATQTGVSRSKWGVPIIPRFSISTHFGTLTHYALSIICDIYRL